MSSELICVDCRNVFYGHSTFCNGLGVCNICQSSRQANDRFEKEMAERRKYERQSSHSYSSSSSATNTDGIGTVFATFAFIIIAVVVGLFVFLGNSPRKEYAFYSPNNGNLKQSLVPGVVYNQYNCDVLCTLNSQVNLERFCNEFDGINTVDNKEVLDWKTGEITSLSRRVVGQVHQRPSFDNSQMCLIEFSMIVDGKVKTGVAKVGSWKMNDEGKLVPYSSFGSTHWK